MRRILHKGFVTVLLGQELKPIDHPMRYRFAKWACNQLTEDTDFGEKKIIFSDEAHLGKYVNSKIVAFGAQKTRNEKPTHPKRVTVWCGF